MKSEDRSRWLLLLGLPFGMLCGLLGVTGTEHRTPILRSFFRYSSESALPFNLAISFMALAGAVVGRGTNTSAALMAPFLPELAGLVVGSVLGLVVAAKWPRQRSLAAIERWAPSALVVIGTVLICATTLPVRAAALPVGLAARLPAAVGLGLVIGLVTSVRGILGAELLIPVLVLGFGADIKIAGSVAVCFSLPVVFVGVIRGSQAHGYPREREYREVVAPMGGGAALGALMGGFLLARATSSFLAFALGTFFIGSAVRGFRSRSAHWITAAGERR